MKKVKFLGLITMVTLTLFNVQIKGEDYFSSIWLENIEVLSQDENRTVRCYSPGSLDCPISQDKVKYIIR